MNLWSKVQWVDHGIFGDIDTFNEQPHNRNNIL